MYYLLFDLETTGLPKNTRYASYKNTQNWPNIIQMSSQLIDDKGQVHGTFNRYMLPVEETISPKASEVSGLTMERLKEYGAIPRSQAFIEFCHTIYQCPGPLVFVAHNLQFDIRIFQANLYASLQNKEYKDLDSCEDYAQHISTLLQWLVDKEDAFICTQKMTTNLVCIPSAYKQGTFKWPKLSELYEFLRKDMYPKSMEWVLLDNWNLHDSNEDVRMLKLCFVHLIQHYQIEKNE